MFVNEQINENVQEKNMDRRQRKTREAIYDAFHQLLESKNYSSITVQEIIDKADIGRSTFYSHFETKDELLKSICTNIFEHVFSDELPKEKSHDFSSSSILHEERIEHILFHIQDIQNEVRGLLSGNSGELFMEYFKSYLIEVFENHPKMTLNGVPKEYVIDYYVCSFANTVKWWVCGNSKYTSEEIAEFYLSVIDL